MESKKFEDEKSDNDDIVIADFMDSYENLSYKTWAGHEFLNSEYFDDCQNKDWVIFHDDDAYVNYPQVNIFYEKTKFVKELRRKNLRRNFKRF